MIVTTTAPTRSSGYVNGAERTAQPPTAVIEPRATVGRVFGYETSKVVDGALQSPGREGEAPKRWKSSIHGVEA